ncbi:MAG: hypothetical protein AAGD86_10965 [Pseudomonadota bacterium]
MKFVIHTLAGLTATLLLSLPLSGLAQQGGRGAMVAVEEAAEISALTLRVASNNRALIYASICDDCPLLTLEVTENTLIQRGGQRLTLAQAERLGEAGATVLFSPQSLEVTRILYWQ